MTLIVDSNPISGAMERGFSQSLRSPVLEVADLSVSFGARNVVSGVSYGILPGHTMGIVGESGCGKSMTALTLMGLVLSPGRVTGSVRLAGKEITRQTTKEWQALRGRDIAMIFQEPMTALNPVMKVGQQVAEVLVLHKDFSWTAAEAEAVRLLDSVGIASPKERARSYPHQMSGGMRQRAMIAMALACEPAVLVADEPTTALDVTIQAQILDLMGDLQDRTGMAIQFISHNLAAVYEIAHDIMVMYAGRIVEKSDCDTLFKRPLHPYTQGLIQTLPDPQVRLDRLPVIKGGVPNLDRVKGCRFADRCPLSDASCRQAEPPLVEHEPNHFAACFKI